MKLNIILIMTAVLIMTPIIVGGGLALESNVFNNINGIDTLQYAYASQEAVEAAEQEATDVEGTTEQEVDEAAEQEAPDTEQDWVVEAAEQEATEITAVP